MSHHSEPALFKGKKVILRPLEHRRHGKYVLRWLNDSAILANLESDLPLQQKDLKAWFKKCSIYRPEYGGVQVFGFAIETLDRETPIGYMLIHTVSWDDGTAFTTSVIGEPKFRGGGYATDAKLALLRYAFQVLRLRKVYAVINLYNAASICYNLRCGYTVEAVLPEKVFRMGKLWDEVWIAITEDVWETVWNRYLRNDGAL